ncbi:MAG TPA: dephospho-CoA kinase [Candidatus Xenobia bacterium]
MTGGIASGKSHVADLLRQLGASVVDTDVISRQIMMAGSPVLARVVERWGGDLLLADGSLNRKLLGQRVFGDEGATRELNSLTHGAILAEMDRQVAAVPSPVVVAVIPLLFEVGAEKRVDEVWLVAAPVEVQVRRTVARDGLSETEARNRIERQWPVEHKRAGAQVVLENTGTTHDLDVATTRAWTEGLKRWLGRRAKNG